MLAKAQAFKMTSNGTELSAFDLGQIAGKDVNGPRLDNPFVAGSPQHHNFEVGRRFAAETFKARLQPSADMIDDDDDSEES